LRIRRPCCLLENSISKILCLPRQSSHLTARLKNPVVVEIGSTRIAPASPGLW
jgi:hypothetical protein